MRARVLTQLPYRLVSRLWRLQQRHLNSWMTLRQYRLGAYSSQPVKLRCEACEMNPHKLSQRQKQVDFGKSATVLRYSFLLCAFFCGLCGLLF